MKDISLDSLGIDAIRYNEWIIKRGDIWCEQQIADHHLSRGDKILCESRLLNIDTQISQLSLGELRTELEQYREFKERMLFYTNQRGVLETLSADAELYVRGVAQNYSGYAQVQAQNLLCFFYGECGEAPSPVEASMFLLLNMDNFGNPAQPSEPEGLQIFPNPATHEIAIKTDADMVELSFIDIHGKKCLVKQVDGQSVNVNVEGLENGMYLLQVLYHDGTVSFGKLLKK